MQTIKSVTDLESLYGEPVDRALWKEIDHINEHYRLFIEQSPFLILATQGANGLDCSPRGDPAGFVKVVNEKQIQIPDRRGNNRLDSLRNIIDNPVVGIIFLIPNVGETIRLSGSAQIVVDSALCQSFAINGKPASSVIDIKVEKVYFQCQKAIARSKLWNPSSYIDRNELPSTGEMLEAFAKSHGHEFNGDEYDNNSTEHIKKTMY